MERTLRDWLACPTCESEEISLLAYDTTLSLQCYDCGSTAEFEVGEPPLHEFGPMAETSE